MEHARVLDAVIAHLEDERRPYAVVGALALHAYGSTRATVDLDVVTELESQPRLVSFLERAGYETLYVSEGYSNHLHADPAWGRVDVVYVAGRSSELLFGGCRRTLALGTREVPVPRPEHLIAMKVHAMKNDPSRTLKELADLQFLVALPEVDQEEARGYFEGAGFERYYDELRSRA